MNENLKDLLISKNLDDIRLGLEICKRENISIKEISDIYLNGKLKIDQARIYYMEYLKLNNDIHRFSKKDYIHFKA